MIYRENWILFLSGQKEAGNSLCSLSAYLF